MFLSHALNLINFKLGSYKPIAGPFMANWDITHRCNSRCQHCHVWQAKQDVSKDLSYEECKSVINQLADLGVKKILFGGYEPLIRKDIFDLLSYANNLGIDVGLNTNGLMVNDKIAGQICKVGVKRVSLSLDGHTPEIHDAMRGIRGSFKKTLMAIDRLKEARANNGVILRITVNTTANHQNLSGLVDIVRICYEKKIDGVAIQPIQKDVTTDRGYFQSDSHLHFRPEDMHELNNQLELTKDKYEDFLIPNGLSEYFDNFQTFCENPRELYRYRCLAGYVTVNIRPNGDIVPCPAWEARMGNVRKDSMAEIWNSDSANEIRKMIKNNQHPICWQSCVVALNIFASYVHPFKFYKLANRNTAVKILQKLKRW